MVSLSSYKRRLTMRAPDVWESARFQAVFLAWSWFRQNGFISARPAAGNASRWAAQEITTSNNLEQNGYSGFARQGYFCVQGVSEHI
jgi:hypothetical protein